jgi:sortase A
MRRGALSLVVMGLSLLGYVGFQLWGTGVYTSRAQARLTTELRMRGFPARPVPGGAVGFIAIPRIGLDMAFVQGIASDDLAKGPGHYPNTPLPGGAGNVVIAGHRTTHAAPFWAVDALREGDQIVVQTRRGTFVYRVRWVKVVAPDALWVTTTTNRPSLTLTTCNPRFSMRERLVVRAVQVYGQGPNGLIDAGPPGFSIPTP